MQKQRNQPSREATLEEWILCAFTSNLIHARSYSMIAQNVDILGLKLDRESRG